MSDIAYNAIQAVNIATLSYCKFLSANDTGDTGGHQAGIYIAKKASCILFDKLGEKGTNKDKYVKIRWQDDFTTNSRFIYYGKGTRDEYRITCLGKGFPFLRPEHTGDLFILIKNSAEDYSGYILETEDEIDTFLGAFAMGPTDVGNIIQENSRPLEERTEVAFSEYIAQLTDDFPTSVEMARTARRIYNEIFNCKENIILRPDEHLISWIDTEYSLFRKIEFIRYRDMIVNGFQTVEEFINIANMALNRRKSRAGKSLEHHLSAIFDENTIPYKAQPTTEGNKKPDFIFPSETAYHDVNFPLDRLVFLGAKTTCKDRWRQIINEANKIRNKHLFTLQQGISAKQLDEMEAENVTLVVPAPYITTYPAEKRGSIWTLQKFIVYAKEKLGV